MTEALLQEAQDPQTAPARLTELSRGDAEVVRAVAQNPNTPIDVLLSLVPRFPKEFVENPVVELLLLEQPELLRRLSARVAQELLLTTPLPASWYSIFASYPSEWVQCAVLKNTNLPEALLFDMAASQFDSVREMIAAKQNASSSTLHRCADLYSEKVYLALVKSPNIEKATLIRLLESPLKSVRMRAAERSDAPTKTIARLQKGGATHNLETYAAPTEPMTEEEVVELSRRGAFGRRIAAGHPNASATLQRALLASQDFETRRRLSGSPVVAIELLESLAKDTTPIVRAEVVKNPRTPLHTLASFDCTKEEGLVKEALAQNPRLPRENFFVLVDNPPRLASTFLQNIQDNPSSPAELLERFAFSSITELRTLASKAPCTSNKLREIFAKAGSEDLVRFAPNTRRPLTEEERDFLLRGYWGKWLLLQDPSLPLQTLREIEDQPARDDSFEGKYQGRNNTGAPPLMHLIAEHPNTDEALFKTLWAMHQNKSDVVQSLSKNPRTPPAILDSLIKSNASYAGKLLAANPSLSRAQKQALFTLTNMGAREALLAHPDADPDLLCQACSADELALRQSAMRDPRTPKNFLHLLRRAGADESLHWFQAPDLSLSMQELASLAKLPSIGGYVHELIIRHPSCTDNLLKEVWASTPVEPHKGRSMRVQHALASRPSLPASLRIAMTEPLLQEALRLFQQEIPLPSAPILSDPTTITLPRLQESWDEYLISRIFCRVGRRVKKDEILFEIESDVMNIDLPSPESGVIGQILVQEWSEVTVGAPLLLLYKKEEPNPAPAPSLLVQQRQSLVAAWHEATHREAILTQLFSHQPALDTPKYTALALHSALQRSGPIARFWTDGHEVISGEGALEKLLAREELALHQKKISAQKIARIAAALHPEIFGAPLCTITESKDWLHPPLLVREPQGVRWVFWARKSSRLICWCLWLEGGSMRHRALTETSLAEPKDSRAND